MAFPRMTRALLALLALLLGCASAAAAVDPLTPGFLRHAEPPLPANSGLPAGLWSDVGRLGWDADEREVSGRKLRFALSSRLFTPSSQDLPGWDDDWVFSFRSSARLRWETGTVLALSLRHRVDWHCYRHGGYWTGRGPRASRELKSDLRAAAEVTLIPGRLHLTFPVTWRQSRYARFVPGARFDGQWRHAIWIDPDLTYTLDGGAYVSLAYESDTLVSGDLTRTYFGESLAAGTVSLWLGVPL